MEFEPGDVIVGLMVTALGVLGLFLAAGAWDDEMYLFGLVLAGFAVVFDFGLLRKHYDRKDAARGGADHG
ncbi:MAG: hypothetical protein ACP5NP_07220 [Acetobacteraceae bacterium]